MAMQDATLTLADFGIRLKSKTPGNHKTTCPRCSERRNKTTDPCLSVTIERDGGAVWQCHHCGWHDGIVPPERRRGTHDTRPQYRRPEPPQPIQASDADEKLRQYFEQERGISMGVVNAFGCYLTKRKLEGENVGAIAFPYYLDGELVNVKYRSRDKRFGQEPKTQRTLFNVDNVDGDTLVIAEGEIDVMALAEAGVWHAVSLPDGAPAKRGEGTKRYEALEASADKLEGISKVIIATDADGPGNILADELASRFGKERCYRASWPSLNDVVCKDPDDVLITHGPEVLRECIENAEPWPLDGVYRAGDVRERMREIYRGEVQKPVSTGIPSLDACYKPLPGKLTIVTGIPGHGKSRWLDYLTWNLVQEHGWKFAIFSPEHNMEQHVKRLTEEVVNKPFEEGPSERMTEREMESALDCIHEHYFWLNSDDEAPTIDWILERAKACALRQGIHGLIIDPFNEIESARATNQREDEFISEMIRKVKRFAQRHDVAVWIVAHPAKMYKNQEGKLPIPTLYDISGGAHWNNKADYGLVVHRDRENERTEVVVRKVREQPECGVAGEWALFRFHTALRTFIELDK